MSTSQGIELIILFEKNPRKPLSLVGGSFSTWRVQTRSKAKLQTPCVSTLLTKHWPQTPTEEVSWTRHRKPNQPTSLTRINDQALDIEVMLEFSVQHQAGTMELSRAQVNSWPIIPESKDLLVPKGPLSKTDKILLLHLESKVQTQSVESSDRYTISHTQRTQIHFCLLRIRRIRTKIPRNKK